MRVLASCLAVLAVALLGVAACGGGPIPGVGGDCTGDAQCKGGHCLELTPGGYKVCAQVPPEATACMTMAQDKCCSSADCTGGGKCYPSTDLGGACAGPFMPPHNECVTEQCTKDADCAAVVSQVPTICAPAGTIGYPTRFCFIAYCRTNADCTAASGGRCATIGQPCCTTPAGLGCVYPGGCAQDSDCQSGSCHLDEASGTGRCLPGVAGCPN
jgi:hypothetical protein